MPKDHPKMRHRSMRAMQNMIRLGEITEPVSCSLKTPYSQGGVHRALGALRKRKHQRVRAYHCRFCGRYHLTSVGT